MKLVQLTEVKYAGKHDLNKVRAQYMRTGPKYLSVNFHSAHVNKEANHVLARFYVGVGISENEVRRQIREYHEVNNIPYGEIVSITELEYANPPIYTVDVQYVGSAES